MTTSAPFSPALADATHSSVPTGGDAWQTAIFEAASGARPPTRPRLRGALPRVPRPGQRSARRLVAGEPRSGVRGTGALRRGSRRGATLRRPVAPEDRHERRAPAAPRRRRRDPRRRDPQGRGPDARRPGPRARCRAAAASRRGRGTRRPSATPSRSRSARRSRAVRRRMARRSRGCAQRRPRPASGSRPSTTRSQRRRRRSTTCSCASPTRPTPTSRSVARKRTSRSGRGASSSPLPKGRSMTAGAQAPLGARRGARHPRQRRAARRSPAPGFPCTRAPGRPSSAGSSTGSSTSTPESTG